MGTKIVTDVAALAEPIQLAAAKKHLRVDDFGGSHPDDALITSLCIAARQAAEHYCGRAFAAKTLAYYADSFPAERYIEVETGPIGAVVSLQYVDVAGTTQTFVATVDDGDDAKRVYLAPNALWPSAQANKRNAVTITYTTRADCPDTVKQAMLLLIGNWYENKNAVVTGTIATELPFGVKALLDTQWAPHI